MTKLGETRMFAEWCVSLPHDENGALPELAEYKTEIVPSGNLLDALALASKNDIFGEGGAYLEQYVDLGESFGWRVIESYSCYGDIEYYD